MSNSTGRRSISSERKAIYYVGMGMGILGLLMFVLSFVSSLWNFGDFEHFRENARNSGILAFGGIFLMISGTAVSKIGAQGFAGSGMVLDPEQSRRDREPWARSAGGLADDAFSEMHTLRNVVKGPPEIKVRCQECQGLNDESARYCSHCGSAL